jgi:type 2 lantibiotic biosynthesis protein LanM
MVNKNPFTKLTNLLATHGTSLSRPLATCKFNDNSLTDNLLWISKFAFDADYSAHARGMEIVHSLFPAFDSFQGKNSTIDTYVDDFEKNNGIEKFLNKYPLLFALKERRVEQYNQYLYEIQQHFEADRNVLSEMLNESDPIGELGSIQLDLGDTHQDGKSTAILQLQCGKKIVYKPRSGGLDVAFNLLLGSLNLLISGLGLKTILIVDRETYSWAEYVDNSPCRSAELINDYYRRCGSLTAIAYLLMGTDFHFENVVACGEFPVLVDLECLFNFTELESYNVLNTGLIPSNSYAGRDKNPHDVSGFGAQGTKKSGVDVWAWKNTDSDAIGLATEAGVFRAKSNQPIFNKKRVSPENYLADLSEGFDSVCRWFLSNKDVFSGENHLLSVFRNRTIRIIARTTQNYRTVLENSYTPPALLSKTARKEIIDASLRESSIALPFTQTAKDELIRMESAAIERMDTPYVLANTSGLHVKESNSLISINYYSISPYEFVLNRIRKLDEMDIEIQASLINSAYVARYGKIRKKKFLAKKKKDGVDISFQNEIAIIADSIKRSACKNSETYFWNGYGSDGGGKLVYNTLGQSLYCGALGISLFLSAVAKYTKNDKYDDIIYSVLNCEIAATFYRSDKQRGSSVDISYCTGISGLIHVLIKVDFIRYEYAALELSKLITADLILKDRRLDFMGGGAGCLAVLADLYRLTKASQVLQTMTLIGDHLLSSRQLDRRSGHLAWTPDNLPGALTGFAHGASGIANSLLQLYEITAEEKYRGAFYDAIDFEDFYFEKNLDNWRDLRGQGAGFQTAWCHGAPGIGLSRLYAYEILKDERLLADVRTAVSATKSYSSNSKDFYCCGNSGRLDFLVEASRILRDEDLFSYARKKVEALIMQKNASGHYQTQDIPDIATEDPSMFRGTSGIGYLLLRCLDPGLRCVIP